jgi:hypothetical protein
MEDFNEIDGIKRSFTVPRYQMTKIDKRQVESDLLRNRKYMIKYVFNDKK